MLLLAKWITLAAAALHCVLGFVAALQNCALRELGLFFTIMAILSLSAIVLTSFEGSFLTMIPALLLILVPGFVVRLATSIILYVTIGSMAAAGFLAYLYYIFSWVFIFL